MMNEQPPHSRPDGSFLVLVFGAHDAGICASVEWAFEASLEK